MYLRYDFKLRYTPPASLYQILHLTMSMYVYESYFFRKNTFVSIYFPEFIHFFRFFVDLHGLKDIIFQL
jgi:hypothetical protein